MADVDKTSGLLYQVKRPAPEIRKYSVSFAKLLTTIASVNEVTSSAPTDLVVSAITFTGAVVYFKLAGGTDGKDYEVKVTVTDIDGNIVTDDVMIKVRIAGLLP